MSSKSFKKITPEVLEGIALRFRALGEPNRLRIVQSLQDGEHSVSELVERTGMTQPNVSRHLQVLVQAGLIGKRKDGLHVFYRIVDEMVEEICAVVCRGTLAAKRR